MEYKPNLTFIIPSGNDIKFCKHPLGVSDPQLAALRKPSTFFYERTTIFKHTSQLEQKNPPYLKLDKLVSLNCNGLSPEIQLVQKNLRRSSGNRKNTICISKIIYR